MVKLSLLTVAACLGLNAGVIYTDFGAGQTYNTGGLGIGTSRSIAAAFDPTASGALQQIDIPLENLGATQALLILLEADASGKPSGNPLDSWLATAADVAAGPQIYTFTSTLTPTLSSGSLYWLVLGSSDANNDYVWMENDIAKHGFAINVGSGWVNQTDGTAPAFDVVAGSSTPEPSTIVLGGLGYIAMAGLLRRGRNRKN